MTPWRVAVIGGGMSGLAAAFRLQELCAAAGRPLDLTLFEGGTRLGGVMGTRDIAGYRVELGADSFITNKPWAVDLCRRLGIEHRLIPTDAAYRRSLVLRKGKPLAVPEGFQLLTPVKLGPVLRTPLFSPWGKLRMALEFVLPAGGTGADESLASFVRRRFGREALERLVQPLVGGIYTSDPERLSVQATLGRFLDMEREHGSLIRALQRQSGDTARRNEDASGARYGLFATLAGGISELIDALSAAVHRSATIRLETRVASVKPSRDTHGFDVQSSSSGQPTQAPDRFDAVVLAVPAYRAADLIRDFAADAAALLSRIEYASTAIVVSGHKLENVEHPLDAFGLVVPAIENRKILAVSFTSRKFPGRAPPGCVQLRTFVGGAMQPELMELSDDEILALVRRELESILGVHGPEDFAVVARWVRAMPQYHVGHLDLVAAIDREMAKHARLSLAGNAYRGVGIPDCIHSGEEAAERVFSS